MHVLIWRINNTEDRNEWCGEASIRSFRKKLLGATAMIERMTKEDPNEMMKHQKIVKDERESYDMNKMCFV